MTDTTFTTTKRAGAMYLPKELLSFLFEPQPWMQRANCQNVDSRLFFPTTTSKTRVDEARGVCAGCVVRKDCLEYGLNQHHGIWGGLTERERRVVRRERKSA